MAITRYEDTPLATNNAETITKIEALLSKYPKQLGESKNIKDARSFLKALLEAVKMLHGTIYPSFNDGRHPSLSQVKDIGTQLDNLSQHPFYRMLLGTENPNPMDPISFELVELASETITKINPTMKDLTPFIEPVTLLNFYHSVTKSIFFILAPKSFKEWHRVNNAKIQSDKTGGALTGLLDTELARRKNDLLSRLTRAKENHATHKTLTGLLVTLKTAEIAYYRYITNKLISDADRICGDNGQDTLSTICARILEINELLTSHTEQVEEYSKLTLKQLFEIHQIPFQDHPLYAQPKPLRYLGIGADNQEMPVFAAIHDDEIAPLCEQLRTKIDNIPRLSDDLKAQAMIHFATESNTCFQTFDTRLQNTTDEAQLQALERDIIAFKDQNDLLKAINSLGNHSPVEQLKTAYTQFLGNLDSLIEQVRTKIRVQNNDQINKTICQNTLRIDEIFKSSNEGSLSELISSINQRHLELIEDDHKLVEKMLKDPNHNDPYLIGKKSQTTSPLDDLQSKLNGYRIEKVNLEVSLQFLYETLEKCENNSVKKSKILGGIVIVQQSWWDCFSRIQYLMDSIESEINHITKKESKAAIEMLEALKPVIENSIECANDLRNLQTNDNFVSSILKLRTKIDLNAQSIEKLTMPFTVEDIKKPCQDQLSQLVELHQLLKSNVDLMAKQRASQTITRLNQDIANDQIAFETLKDTPITDITRFKEQYLQLQEKIIAEHQKIDELERISPLLEDSLVNKIQEIKAQSLTEKTLKDASEDYFKKLHSEAERQKRMTPFTQSLKDYLATINTRLGLRRDKKREETVLNLIESLENYHNKSEAGMQALLTQLEDAINQSPGHRLQPILHAIKAKIYDELDLPKTIMVDNVQGQPIGEINKYLVKKEELNLTISEMRNYGNSLQNENDPTGQVVIQLSNTLKSYADDFFKRYPTKAPSQEECRRFFDKFYARLHSEDGIMEKHSHIKWLPIVKNIIAALLLILPIKMLCSKLGKEKRCSFFGEQTRKMTMRDKIEQALRDIPISEPVAAGV